MKYDKWYDVRMSINDVAFTGDGEYLKSEAIYTCGFSNGEYEFAKQLKLLKDNDELVRELTRVSLLTSPADNDNLDFTLYENRLEEIYEIGFVYGQICFAKDMLKILNGE